MSTDLNPSTDALAILDEAGEDPWDIRDSARDELDAAWDVVEQADWLDPKEARKALSDAGRLLRKAAREVVLDPGFWRAVLREARELKERIEEGRPERLRNRAAKKRAWAATAAANSNEKRANRLLAEAAELEEKAAAAEARRGNGQGAPG